MGNAGKVVVDHEEVESVVQEIGLNIQDIQNIKKSSDALLDTLITEASMGNGTPAPVFGPILNATRQALTRLNGALDVMSERLQMGADALQQHSASVKELAETGAQNVNNIDTAVSSGGSGSTTGGGGTAFASPSSTGSTTQNLIDTSNTTGTGTGTTTTDAPTTHEATTAATNPGTADAGGADQASDQTPTE